jgi:hypothetical protein
MKRPLELNGVCFLQCNHAEFVPFLNVPWEVIYLEKTRAATKSVGRRVSFFFFSACFININKCNGRTCAVVKYVPRYIVGTHVPRENMCRVKTYARGKHGTVRKHVPRERAVGKHVP